MDTALQALFSAKPKKATGWTGLMATNYLADEEDDDYGYVLLMNTASSPSPIALEYSLDNGKTWTPWECTDGKFLQVDFSSAGSTMCIRAAVDGVLTFSTSPDNFWLFDSYGVEFSGNAMSLLARDFESLAAVGDYCFYKLFASDGECINGFSNFNGLLLPATTLGEHCYLFMFLCAADEASSMPCFNGREFAAPELPATELKPYCYSGMFNACGIRIPPTLPAEKMADACYEAMFMACYSLESFPLLPVSSTYNCLAPSCYMGMFSNCPLPDKMPALMSQHMPAYAYCRMFYGCTSLSSQEGSPNGVVTMKPIYLNGHAMDGMFSYCSSLVSTAILAPEKDAQLTCDGKDFYGMFSYCSSLSALSCAILRKTSDGLSLRDDPFDTSFWNWMLNVHKTGVYTGPDTLSSLSPCRGAAGIPEGWSIEYGLDPVYYYN